MIRTIANIFSINVFVEDRETHTPLEGLTPGDFQVIDNGTPVSIGTFARGAKYMSPVVWFLVDCPEQGQVHNGAAFLADDREKFEQTLSKLDKTAFVGVAHWCAGGEAEVDSLPTQDRDSTVVAIQRLLSRTPVASAQSSSGLALQRAIDLVLRNPGPRDQSTVPVIVVLSDAKIEIPENDADLMAKRLLYHGAILYSIEARPNNREGIGLDEAQLSLSSVSLKTGGRAYYAADGEYIKTISSIFTGLRQRYILGLAPRSRVRQWHDVRIQLTDSAMEKHPSARVTYGAGYLMTDSFNTNPPYSISNHQRKSDGDVDAALARSLDAPAPGGDIHIEVDAHGFIGSDELVEFDLEMARDQLSWEKLSNGDRRTKMSIVVASYSEGGERLGVEMVQFDVTRDEAHLPITGDRPFNNLETMILPANTSRIRVVVRDEATGKAGSQDLLLKDILSGPRSPMVIR